MISMADFMWHRVSDKEKEEIKQQAKHLLEEFGAKLDKIKFSGRPERESEEGLREEGKGWNTDPNFRDLMLLNAPFVEDDFVVAEKGGWK